MNSITDYKRHICDIGERIYKKGFVAANDGNISVRIDDNRVLITPTGHSKGYLTPDDIVLLDLDGNVIEGTKKVSSETPMHLEVYRRKASIRAVVHAHPPYATVFAVANRPLDKKLLPEAILTLGDVPVAKYGTPSTAELSESVVPYLDTSNAVLLESHGAVTWGVSLQEAYFRMETLEFYAQITYLAEQLGTVREITPENLQKLDGIRSRLGL